LSLFSERFRFDGIIFSIFRFFILFLFVEFWFSWKRKKRRKGKEGKEGKRRKEKEREGKEKWENKRKGKIGKKENLVALSRLESQKHHGTRVFAPVPSQSSAKWWLSLWPFSWLGVVVELRCWWGGQGRRVFLPQSSPLSQQRTWIHHTAGWQPRPVLRR